MIMDLGGEDKEPRVSRADLSLRLIFGEETGLNEVAQRFGMTDRTLHAMIRAFELIADGKWDASFAPARGNGSFVNYPKAVSLSDSRVEIMWGDDKYKGDDGKELDPVEADGRMLLVTRFSNVGQTFRTFDEHLNKISGGRIRLKKAGVLRTGHPWK